MAETHTALEAALAVPAPDHMQPVENRDVSWPKFEKMCRSEGINPATLMTHLLKRAQANIGLDDEGQPLDLKDREVVDLVLRSMKFVEGEKKSVEVTGDDGGPVEMVFKWANE